MKRLEDQTGKRYGKLTVLGDAPRRGEHRMVEAICDCGTRCVKQLSYMRTGDTKSCGCYKITAPAERAKKRGLSKHPLYRVYHSMIERCSNPNSADYGRYGARGIRVCREWAGSYLDFYEWAISHGWEKGLHTDRVDNDGPYSPENCRFVKSAENVRNGRAAKLSCDIVSKIRNEYGNGTTQTQIASTYSIAQSTVSSILLQKTWRL